MSADIRAADFTDAVAKGLGRAVLWMREGAYQPSFNQLRRLVLRWQAFDYWMSSYREVYNADLIEASTHGERMIETLLASIHGKGRKRDQKQRVRTAMELGIRGDSRAIEALKSSFDPAEMDWLAGEPIVRLEGIEGIEWLVERIRPHFRDQHSELSEWMEVAVNRDGQETVDAWLAKPAQAWLREKQIRPPRPPKPEFLPVSVEVFLANENIDAARWAATATKADIKAAISALPTVVEEKNFRRVLRAIYIRQKHVDPGFLIEVLPRIPEANLSQFYNYLKRFKDPRIRVFGIELSNPIPSSVLT